MSAKVSAAKGTGPAKLLFSLLAGLAVTAVVLLAASVLVSRETLPPGPGKIYVIVALVAGAACSSLLFSRGRGRKLLSALLSAAAMELVVLCAGLALGGGRVEVSALPYQLLCVALGSITGCIMTAGTRRRKRR